MGDAFSVPFILSWIKLISHRKAPCKRKQHCWMLNVVPPPPPPPLPPLFIRDHVAQYLIRLHSSSNSVAATHANYAWSPKSYGLYPSYEALQVPVLLGVVASVCT